MQLLNSSWNGKPAQSSAHPGHPAATIPARQNPQSPNALRNWLLSQLAQRLELEAADIDPEKDLSEYGLSSLEAVNLSGELENYLTRRLPPTLLWDYPSVESLVEYLSSQNSLPTDPQAATGGSTSFNAHPPINPQQAQEILENIDNLSDAQIDALLERLLSQPEGQG